MDIDKLKVTIGNKIYDLRIEHDLTQEEFAKRLDIYISKGHISKIESGLIMPSAEFIRSVAIAFNISPLFLLNIEGQLNEISSREITLLNLFRNLSPDAQNTILHLIDIMIKK